MSRFLHRLAVFSARHRALVIGGWLVVLAALLVVSHQAGTKYSSSSTVDGSDSAAATELMERSFSAELADTSPIVFHTDEGSITDPEHRATVEASLHALSQDPDVASVTDPFAEGSATVSADGTTAYANVVPAEPLGDLSVEEAEAILDTATEPAEGTEVEVAAGGQLGTKVSKPETATSELVGILAAMLILVLVFGTITAMALPIASAIVGLMAGLSIVSLLGHAIAVPDVAPTIATMIGLGVGIDYALFIVTRARSARHEGRSLHDAIGHAAATSGSAVAFAGGTVVIALLALAVSGLSFITVLGQAAAIVVVVAVLASMTLLPALLSLCGDGIEKLRIGRDRRPTLGHSAVWQQWGERLARRPRLYAATSVLVLVGLSVPVLSLGLGLTDQSSAPESTSSRQAYDQLTESFGAGANAPLLVTVDLGSEPATGPDDPRLAQLHGGLSAADGVQAVGMPQLSQDGTAALMNVIPAGSPTSDVTKDLVDEVRDATIPASGLDAHVGGSTAQQLDLAELIGDRLPLIIGVVVALSVLLLMIAFRTVVAPLQAALVNLLAVGAAYGIVTAVFQEGIGITAIGLDGAIPIVSYVPMMMFAILFGLSMDYQVFLLSRVREEVDAGRSPRQAVIDGLAGTGKVIVSAGAIMVAVFASFVLNGDPTVKEFGVGLASAILIAVGMVVILLPAVMLLTGTRTWWLPGWLDRILPHLDVEGGSAAEADEVAEKSTETVSA
ncbi:MMPL family transporter [Nocardioides sp. HM23]|uniref:MMPL family transporter n=1 Tax=Nocardioides bizhenqiangii TaxID=3095076 RepID=UPI002ACA3534|nr:MMPL family transporter [Nocardioides sp. HM23]MDZ5620069.1 MMPL family transporter [Nocardioides sp. HM23]